ncbi:MAG TPA: hypothetical protein VGG33_07440 [Polyangia bacterium]
MGFDSGEMKRASLPARRVNGGGEGRRCAVVGAFALVLVSLPALSRANAAPAHPRAKPSPAETAADGASKAKAGKAKYYFAVADVQDEAKADEATKVAARQVLQDDLAARPEFTSDLGDTTPDALPDELRRRNLKGFHVTLKLIALTQEPKPPRPGGRLKQLAVTAKVAVFGTTIPDAKLAFGGDGEATVEAEIVERRQAEEAATLTREVLVQAVRQAVDQAVGKLGERPSKPFNETKRRKRPSPGGGRTSPR